VDQALTGDVEIPVAEEPVDLRALLESEPADDE
jgi:hypothetical protein